MQAVIVQWLVAFIVAMAPPNRPQTLKEAKETPEAAIERYSSIARDVSLVASQNVPLPIYKDKALARTWTALSILTTMYQESRFRRDVDLGLGKKGIGDHGKSFCLMQIKVGKGRSPTWNKVKQRFAYSTDPANEIEIGWTGKELLSDRVKCITAGYRKMKVSMDQCSKLKPNERLAAYVSGSCDRARSSSRVRMGLTNSWMKNHKPEFDDTTAFEPPAGGISMIAEK